MLAYVFPGQGSQKKGMGDTLFHEFKELVEKADEILGYSIKELCLEDPNERLSDTRYTQPAIYVVNALSYLKKIKEIGKKPDFVAGHSLGEYNALFAAGAFDFETGLKLVKKRGELMGEVSGGGMASIVGLNEQQIIDVLKNNNLNTLDIANYNSSHQIVISGPKEDIEKSKNIFEEIQQLRLFAILNVSGAFHSRYMKDARKEFANLLASIKFNKLSIPVISNTYARKYNQDEIRTTLAMQMDNSVKWTESICYLMGKGVTEFEEIGCGKVLTGLIRRIQRESKPLIIEDEEDGVLEPGKIRKSDIFKIIIQNICSIIPELKGYEFKCNDRLPDLGANLVDRAEIINMTMESLILDISRIELHGAKDIGGLVDVFYEKL